MTEKRSLCKLEEQGILKNDPKIYKKLVRRGKYICMRCGRVARKKRNLCRGEEL